MTSVTVVQETATSAWRRPLLAIKMAKLKRRVTQDLPEPDAGAGFSVKEGEHPAGEAKHGGPKQLLLALAFTLFMCASCCSYDYH